MNKIELQKEVLKFNLELTEEMLEKFEIYAGFLLEYNLHTNLTAIKTKEEVYLKHFLDSLTLFKIDSLESGSILDVGTGAGFPGLVLAIVRPNLQVTLLDSNNKKITFLQECIKKLGLTNVETIYARAENYTCKIREHYDYVTSRAVAELRILLELNIPAVKVGGYFLVMKGNVEEELQKAQSTLKVLNCEIIVQEEFELMDAGHRSLLKIKKSTKTDKKYPRSYDKIKKKSL